MFKPRNAVLNGGMNALVEIITFLGGSTLLLGAVAWLIKSLAKAMLDRDLKQFEQLGLRNLEVLKAELQRAGEAEKRNAEAAGARNKRIRTEILRWANPILGAVRDLRGRLENVLQREAYLALQRMPTRPIPPNWSISYDYFMPSTVYLFGTYFYWVQRLRAELSFELFESHAAKDAFLAELRRVSDALGSWPLEPSCTGKDAQVFNLQQRALADALSVRADGQRCMSYADFTKVWEQPEFTPHVAPLRLLLEGLADDGECRWKRLEAVLSALKLLEKHCESILQRPDDAP
ncbi:MAG: hypothetical protein ABJA77_11205 [Variovorax sp.]